MLRSDACKSRNFSKPGLAEPGPSFSGIKEKNEVKSSGRDEHLAVPALWGSFSEKSFFQADGEKLGKGGKVSEIFSHSKAFLSEKEAHPLEKQFCEPQSMFCL